MPTPSPVSPVPMLRRSSIVDEFGDSIAVEVRSPFQSFSANHYDVVNRWSQTDQWQHANNLPGSVTDDNFTRQKLTAAARFEYANNSYCRGIVLKMAQEVIGKGPRLEIEPLSTSERSMRAAKVFEDRWQEWADESNFVENLQMGIVEEIVGGEVFQMFRQNRGLKTVPIDFQSFEGIQIQSPWMQSQMSPFNSAYPIVDGLQLDAQGNTTGFYKLRAHPGNNNIATFGDDADLIPADIMVQMFRKERPSQYRGTSHLAPCIELFGKLRRYTEATIETAENAASILGTIETAFQPNMCTPGQPQTLPFGSGQLMTLPDGWKMNSYRPEVPPAGYPDFKGEILHEIISCLLMPWNIASADSSEFNFASGQLDHRIFERYITFQRQRQEQRLINRFFRFWMEFASYVPGLIPTGLGAFESKWYWPSQKPIDPVKAANAAKTLKEAGLLDEQQFWQGQGVSAKDAIDKRLRLEAYEIMRRKELGAEMGVNLDSEEEKERKSKDKLAKQQADTQAKQAANQQQGQQQDRE